MNPNLFSMICFGEALIDVFETHKKIGGAPLNVASRLASFGVNSKIISRVGDDALGKEIIDFLNENNIQNGIQIDKKYKTGEVIVTLSNSGSASYDIAYPVAWDKIECTTATKNDVEKCDALLFVSLVCRDAISRKTLTELMPLAKFKIFDVNLRKPYDNLKLIVDLMLDSDFIKFNDEELAIICNYMQSPFIDIEKNILFIAEKTKITQICVTKGSQGAVLYFDNQFFHHSGFIANVIDTVGAGDSFLAGLIFKLFTEKNPEKALSFACAVGALVTENEGANPKISDKEIEKLRFSNNVN